MIYRLYNTVTNQYATAEEMKYLRVNAEGAVERIVQGYYPFPKSAFFMPNLGYHDWQLTTDWVVFWLSPLITKIHLCDDCIYTYPECKGNPLFGDGYGNDNIYECNAHEVSK